MAPKMAPQMPTDRAPNRFTNILHEKRGTGSRGIEGGLKRKPEPWGQIRGDYFTVSGKSRGTDGPTRPPVAMRSRIGTKVYLMLF